MPKILLLTAEVLPHDDHETERVAAALNDLGVATEIVAWTADGVAEISADLAVIRSTWDYTRQLPAFLDLLERLPIPLTNPAAVVRWNAHKGYLVELAGAGAPVVPTRLVRAADLAAGEAIVLPSFGTPEIIVKPAISAGAVGVGRFGADSAGALAHLTTILRTADALVQPFQPEVSRGERSLIHLGGVFSHAVRKTPAEGEFRVQEQFGGVNRPHTPSGAELAAAAAALATVPGGSDVLTYARIDLVGSESEPLIMELELIEPELFLPTADGSAERFAQALAAMV